MCSMLTFLLIEEFTLARQSIALRHETINLFSPLKHALDRLMQYYFGLIQLLLNLHNTIRLLRILVFHNVIFELWEGQGGVRVREGSARISRKKLIDNFGEQLVRYKGWIVVVADDHTGDAFRPSIDVEGVGYGQVSDL